MTRSTSTVWFLGAATAFSLLGDQTLYSTLPVLFEDLGLRPIEVGLILSANRWVRLATNELAHRMVDVADQRLMFVTALGLGAAMTAIYATTPGFALFLTARLVWGLCWSFIRHLGLLSAMEVSEDGTTGQAAGRLGGISRVGSVGGLFGGAVLVDLFGFGPALSVLAALSLIAVPIGWNGFASVSAPQTTTDGGPSSPIISVLGFAHGMVGAGLVMSTLGAVLDERTGRSDWLSATALTGGVLAMRFLVESGTAGRLGAISDRRGIRLTSTGAFAVGAGMLVTAASTSVPAVLVVAVITFFVCGTMLGAGLIGFVGAEGSRSLARYVTANDLGAASGPLIGWIALGLFDQRTLGLLLGAGIYLSAGIAAFRSLPRGSSDPPVGAWPT